MDISVIIPVYNVEKYLRQCLDSVLMQDFKGEIEVICINDGSTDGSFNILDEYASNYKSIVLINQKNCGLAAARNRGITESTGEYIFFLDSDDYLKHEYVLANMHQKMFGTSLDFIVSSFEYDYDEKYKNYSLKVKEELCDNMMSGRRFFEKAVRARCLTYSVWNKLYKRQFIADNCLLFIDGIFYEDVDFTTKAFYLAKQVKYIEEVSVMYRQRAGSIMSAKNSHRTKKRLNDRIAIADSLNQFNRIYLSKYINKVELNMYFQVIEALIATKNRKKLSFYKKALDRREVTHKFLSSKYMKHKVFGLFCIIYFKFI